MTAPAPAPRTAPTTPTPPAPAPGAPPRPTTPTPPAPPAPGGTQRPPAGAPQGQPAAGGQGAGFQAGVGFTLKYVDQEELKTREFEYSEQAAVEREAAPQGLLSTVVQGIDLDHAIQEVSLDDDFFKRLVATVSIAGDLAKEGVNAVTVNLEYPGKVVDGKDPDHVDGFLFKPPDQLAAHTFTNWLNDAKDLSYRYQVDVHFNADSPWQGKSTEVVSDWQTTRNRQLTIDPLDEIGLFDVTIALGSVDDKQISQVQVEMWYQDEKNGFESQETFVLSPGQPPVHWKLRLSDPSLHTYRYRTTYVFQDHLRHQTDWQSSEDAGLVINNPYQGAIKVRLVPLLDAGNLVEADVNVTYKEPDTGFERSVQTTFSGSPLTAQPVAIPTLAAEPAGYTYDVTVVRQDGSVFESGPLAAAGGTGVVVVSDGAGSTHRIRVKLLDTNLGAAGLAALKVFLEGPGDQPDTAEALFTPSQAADQTLALVQPDAGGPFTYKYRVVGYSLAGLPVPGDSGTTSEAIFLARLPRP